MMMPNQMLTMLQQLKANPVQFLMRQRMNVPADIPTDNPKAMIDHLLKTGQITQEQINQAYQMMQRFR